MNGENIQIDVIKLATGDRILRLSELTYGLSLEKKLIESDPIVGQKERLLAIFQAALHQAALAA